jgi:hypothetical protein
VLTFTPAAHESGSTKCTVTLSEAGENPKTADAELTIAVNAGAWWPSRQKISMHKHAACLLFCAVCVLRVRGCLRPCANSSSC